MKIALRFLLSLLMVFLFAGRIQAEDETKTLVYHLATNAVGRTKGFSGTFEDMGEAWGPPSTNLNKERFSKIIWSTNFWLHGARGLSATPIGFTNLLGGQGLPTMVSPRHYLVSAHMHPEGYLMAFLDTNNVLYWRKTKERYETKFNDTSVGLLDEDLPPSVGFLPLLPASYADYMPTNKNHYFQGIGMNQVFHLFSQPMQFFDETLIHWDSTAVIPNGVGTNWSVRTVAGDSSNPEMILISNQLVMVSHTWGVGAGPNYAIQIDSINKGMHYLSTNNHLRTDYQLTLYSLTNFQKIHQ